MITIREARAAVLQRAGGPLESERVPIVEAVGRILAAPLAADTDLPPFDRVTMDGFAVRAADVAPGAVLPVTAEVAAGAAGELALRAGEAHSIMTGAPLPPGADAVVPIEWTEAAPGGRPSVRMLRTVAPGQHVAARGEDLRAGAVVGRPGELVTTLSLSLLIAAGAGEATVVRRPRLALLTTGDELVPPGAPLSRGRIRESNGPALASLLRDCGAAVTNLGVAGDTRRALDERLAEASGADLLVLTGGASVGKYDFAAEAVAALGARRCFDRVSVKPGKPTMLFEREGQLVFCLPGNPVAALMTARVLVCAAVAARGGLRPEAWPEPGVPLAAPVRRIAERDLMLPARRTAAGLLFDGWHGSGDLACMAGADGFAFVERGTGSAPAGTPAAWFPFPGAPAW